MSCRVDDFALRYLPPTVSSTGEQYERGLLPPFAATRTDIMAKLSLNRTAELLLGQDDLLILCHKYPDGDTLGSAFALCRALRSLGKRANVMCSDLIPPKFD